MKLLAIETAVTPGSLAAFQTRPEAEPQISAQSLPGDLRTARSLAPALRDLLNQTGWPTGEIDAVAVTTGPGSFTGLRLGVTAAKTLAYVASAMCVPINTLAVLAAQAGESSGWAVLDAQRRELFAARFEAGQLTTEPVILPEDDWLTQLTTGDTVIGPILKQLAPQLPTDVVVTAEENWQPQAETVARLALTALESGNTVGPFQLLPNYYRLSAAEEKLQRQAES